ncbi:MAG: DEAD/DEAH box helicase, partial [Proteobacteria bacterium]
MALHPSFPENPHVILDPSIRWFPADEAFRSTSFEKLLPPLVPELRKQVQKFRDNNYDAATQTSRSLLNWWFKTPHLIQTSSTAAEFRYFFSQREALETIVYLIDVVKVKDKFDLIRFDHSGSVSANMFDETWKRFVVKMATGAGKTILAVLAIAQTKRPALIVVPTIDLLLQWQTVLQKYFSHPIGLLGGGNKSVEFITVATYDSAALTVETLGNRFGFLIFDECHHLPANHY